MDHPDKDYSRYDHPMHSLARALGDGVEYPVPASDAWVRVLLALGPCSLLVVVSIVWPASAPFLLTFAGAFASIQLVEPYRRWSTLVRDHLSEAREQRQTALDWARTKRAFNTSPKLHQGIRAVGYSPAAHARARRRFPRLARRWRRSFLDFSASIVDPLTSQFPPAARLKWLYEDHRFDYWGFVRGGKSRPTRIVRASLGLLPYSSAQLRYWFERSSAVRVCRRWRTERLLSRVGTELVRATANRTGDAAVRTLAGQLDLVYRSPEINDGWVFREASADLIPPAPQ